MFYERNIGYQYPGHLDFVLRHDVNLSAKFLSINTYMTNNHTEFKFSSELTTAELDHFNGILDNWIDQPSQEQMIKPIIQEAEKFGYQLLLEMKIENVKMGVTQELKTGYVLRKGMYLEATLQSGSLYETLDCMLNDQNPEYIIRDEKYFTEERMQKYAAKIQEYLGL